MRRFLSRKPLKWHLCLALVTGTVARGLCAWFVYGPQALDDYKHGVWPAYQFFAGLPLDLPEYRSHLLVWILAAFIKAGFWFGAESALAQVRAMYFGLAALSLLGIYGTYLFVRGVRSKIFGPTALYLTALFPLLPFVGTRAFGEAIAMSFTALGFGVLEDARRSRSPSFFRWTAGFLCLGMAVLFRFQAGLLFAGYAAVLLYLRLTPAIGAAVCAGVATLFAQVGVDVLSGKAPMATLINYLCANEGGAAQYGVSPWYNTWAFALALTLPPFSFVFYRQLRGVWRRHWTWLVPFLLYVLAHSLIPHKEERFLYPILILEMWAIAGLWSAAARNRWARTVYTRAFLIICVPALFVACLINTQEGEIEPAAIAESRYGAVTYLDHESLFGMSRVQFYFLRPPSVLQAVGPESFNVNAIDEALERNPAHKAVALLTSVPDTRDQLHALEGVETWEARCLKMQTSGSLIDRLLYSLNPAHNQRRRPTWYLFCERS